MTESLSGKVAIVTGAGSPIGLGRAMTVALVRAGARVAMLDINKDWLDQSANDVREIGGDDCVITVLSDVSKSENAKIAVDKTLTELGGLHILVNNAGITVPGSFLKFGPPLKFWESTNEQWDMVIGVNLLGSSYMARAAVGHMLDQEWGRIIGITTGLRAMVGVGGSPYGPSKAGQEAWMAILAKELEGTGVTANLLSPGGIVNTNVVPPDHDRSTLLPPEVMQAPIVWLASEASSQTNGGRVSAFDWDESLPLEERLKKAAAPEVFQPLAEQSKPAGQ